MTARRARLIVLGVVIASTGCASDEGSRVAPTSSTSQTRSTTAASTTTNHAVTADIGRFPSAAFAGLSDEPLADSSAVELQAVLDASAGGHGLTATVITEEGVWSGATGFAAGDRAMTADDQMSIASITKTLLAAQVMRLVLKQAHRAG